MSLIQTTNVLGYFAPIVIYESTFVENCHDFSSFSCALCLLIASHRNVHYWY